MTPQELYAAVDARRRELGLAWWQVSVKCDAGYTALARLKDGGRGAYDAAMAWLVTNGERHTGPPRTE